MDCQLQQIKKNLPKPAKGLTISGNPSSAGFILSGAFKMRWPKGCKLIKLTQGKHAIVDIDNYEELNKNKWYALKVKNTYYACRDLKIAHNKHTLSLMHREILNCKTGEITDHINHNGLDNRICNLHKCTNAENLWNTRFNYKGIYYIKKLKKWRVRIRVNGKRLYSRGFKNKNSALALYKRAKLLRTSDPDALIKERLKGAFWE